MVGGYAGDPAGFTSAQILAVRLETGHISLGVMGLVDLFWNGELGQPLLRHLDLDGEVKVMRVVSESR
jgi:hypothetical protein